MSKKTSTPAAQFKPRRSKTRTAVKSRRQSGSSTKSITRPAQSTAMTPDTSMANGRVAATNMMDAMGGRDRLVEILRDSNHPKANALVERLLSSAHAGENFATAYTAVGMKAPDILAIFSDVTQSRAFIHAMMEGEEVVRSLMRAAKDKLEPHDRCNGGGKVLDRKTGESTDVDCKQCFGTGYIQIEGSLESQKVFLELIQWRKTGGLVQIDARKIDARNQGQQLFANLAPGEVPSVTNILKRADQQVIQIPSQASSSLNDSTPDKMPEEAVEAEPV